MSQNRTPFFVLAFSFLLLASTLKAQIIWDVADSANANEDRRIYSLSCNEAICTVCGLAWENSITTYGDTIIIKHSTDGGRTWVSQNSGLPLQRSDKKFNLQAVCQIDSLNAVAVGDTALILRTTDGGKNWFRQTCPSQSIFQYVHFSDSSTGIITGTRPPIVLTTIDAGVHWKQALPTQGKAFGSCHSYGGGKFSVFGLTLGPIYNTRDNWKTVDSGSTIPPFYGDTNHYFAFTHCQFGSNDTLLAYGTLVHDDIENQTSANWGAMDRSIDGGLHWEQPTAFENKLRGPIASVSSIERDTVYAGSASGYGKILFSSDRGVSWRVDTILLSTNAKAQYVRDISTMKDGTVLAVMAETLLDNSFLALGHSGQARVEMYEPVIYGTHIYPNPATSTVTIKSIDILRPIYVVDVLGRMVLQQKLSDQGEVTFDVSTLPRGIYMVQLNHSNRILSIGKIVIAGIQ